ncbi:MAG: hypothetical protein AB1758_21790, partial [Candidatus Eremiobacterota bacterium]
MTSSEGLASDISPVWNTCLEVLESALDSPVRNSLQGSRPLGLEGTQLKIGVQGSFSRDFLTKPANREVVRSVLRQVTGEDLHVEFVALRSDPWDSTGPSRAEASLDGEGPETSEPGESCLNP